MASETSRIRRNMYRQLEARGFVRGGHGAVRMAGEVFQFIDLQRSQSIPMYTFNLGIHISFLPGFFSRKQTTPAEIELVDCMLNTRIGYVMPGPVQDIWWPADELTDAFLAEVLNRGVLALEEAANQWGDIESCLLRFPPTEIAACVPAPPSDQPGDSGFMPKLWELFPSWLPNPFKIGVFLTYAAMRLERCELAHEYAAVTLAQVAFDHDKAALRKALAAACPRPVR